MKYVSDLQLFSQKLCDLMKKRGMTYKNNQPDPILLYNAFYPHDQLQIIDQNGNGFGRSEYSEKTRKFDNWIKGKLNITVRQSRQSGVARATCPD